MAQVLVGGPGFTAQDRACVETVRRVVADASHDASLLKPGAEAPDVRRAVRAADAVVAVLDEPIDADTLVVLGYAMAFRRPVVGLRSDQRPGPSPLLRSLVAETIPVTLWDGPEWRERLLAQLATVRVYAGNLVRDAVPKILEAEGKPLRFRQAAGDAYPSILKRKLVETAQALEESEWGVEQETIADLLEVLETFLNVRAYDRESLRSIKEGKWRKRGGFQKGYLVDEEPRLASG